MGIPLQFALGIILSGLIGWAAYRHGALSKSGVLGALIVGTAIFGFGGWVWGLVLIAFFVLSSLLSRYRETAKARLAAEKFDKGSQRDIGQALANGGAGALIAALAYLFYPQPVMLAAFVGAMATVNADTWATEIGVLSRQPPRLLTTLRPVEPGTSGGVSALGTLATVAGGLAIGLMAVTLLVAGRLAAGPGFEALGSSGPASALWLLPVSAAGGLAGSLFDSLLGATAQAIYICPTCQKETEKRVHTCGAPTRQARGWRWLNNDLVNFISSLFGAAAAVGVWLLVA